MTFAQDRAGVGGLRPAVLWFTGYSGAGKTTIARELQRQLRQAGQRVDVLDGDVMRRGLCRDLAFSEADRAENVRRVTEVAKLMFDAGSVVIVALISPLQAHRDAARKSFETGDFFEIFIDTPLNVRARSGLMKDFTGVDAVYEPPMHPDVRITTVDMTPIEAASRIVETLRHSLPTITAQK
jgi:adenylyl-sulfate kinase